MVGGGYIGLELGYVYAALGSKVTVVEMTDGLLPGVDRDLVRPLARRVREAVREIHLGTKVTDASRDGDGASRREGEEPTNADVRPGPGRRRPAAQTAGLGLEKTRARLTDARLRRGGRARPTAEPHIFAIGDVAGEPMLAHKAMRQGKVAAEAIAGGRRAFDNRAIPAVVFTDPEIAWCGLTETRGGGRGAT